MAELIGIMGGTFDPLHDGHLACAEAAREALALDRVLFVPCGVPSFKQGTVEASAADRLAMTRLGTAGCEGFAVDDLEVFREGVTYTVDTLARLKERWPQAELAFIMGADAARALPTWDRPGELAELARFAVVERAGDGLSAAELAELEAAGFRIDAIEAETPAVSSQEIRRRVRNGDSVAGLVPEAVERYIMEHHLYC